MAKNSVQRGEILDLVAPSGGVVSGVAVRIGDRLVIPSNTAAEGETFSAYLEEVWRLPKTAAQAITALQRVYWNNGTHRITTTAAGNLFAGFAIKAQGADDATADVLIDADSGIVGDIDAAIALVNAAVATSNVGAGDAGKLVKLDGAGKIAGRVIETDGATLDAVAAALAKMRTVLVTIATGQSAGTAVLGAGTWDAKPVGGAVLNSTTGDGKKAAATPTVKGVVAGGTLTLTLLDKDGVATVNAGTGNLVFAVTLDAR